MNMTVSLVAVNMILLHEEEANLKGNRRKGVLWRYSLLKPEATTFFTEQLEECAPMALRATLASLLSKGEKE